jgi:hypothetical protein
MRAFDPKHLSMPRELNCNRGSPKIPKRSSPNLRLRIPHSVPGIELLVEVFNSDVYENWVNSKAAGNRGGHPCRWARGQRFERFGGHNDSRELTARVRA